VSATRQLKVLFERKRPKLERRITGPAISHLAAEPAQPASTVLRLPGVDVRWRAVESTQQSIVDGRDPMLPATSRFRSRLRSAGPSF